MDNSIPTLNIDASQLYQVVTESILEDLDENRIEKVIWALYAKYGPVRHQIESFEKFMDVLIKQIVLSEPAIVVDSFETFPPTRHVVEFKHISIGEPTFKESNGQTRKVYPYECRQRRLTYNSSVLADIEYKIYDISDLNDDVAPKIMKTQMYREVLLCQIPIMVKSKYCNTTKTASLANECPLDTGGYFIINGSEKIIISQERARNNFPYVFPVKQPNKYEYVCEVRSLHEKKVRSTSTLYAYITKSGSTPEIFIEVPFVENFQIPLVAVFKILDITDKKDMISIMMRENDDLELAALMETIIEQDLLYTTRTTEELFEWIGKEGTNEPTREKRVKAIDHIFANEFLPHLGLDRSELTMKKKIIFFGKMLNKLCRCYLKRINTDDRDDYAYKRVEANGILLASLFRPFFRTVTKSMNMVIRKNVDQGKPFNINDAINHKRITSGFKYALSTGNWGVQKGGSTYKGVAQVHSRMTHTASLSNLRRINVHINKEGKMPKPRQLHRSTYGFLCCVETPEGQGVGLLKNLAVLAHIRVGSDPQIIIDLLESIDICTTLADAVQVDSILGTDIYVNGVFWGYTHRPMDLICTLRKNRFDQALQFDTTFCFDRESKSIFINCDAGCILRPAFVVENLHKFAGLFHQYYNAPYLIWDILMREGVIEYFDNEEQRMYRVAVYPDELVDMNDRDVPYTHLEIDMSSLFGSCAATIPFPDRDQAPRIIYQVAMGKQSTAKYCLNSDYRSDTVSQYLMYPQQPLVHNFYDKLMNMDKLPTGQNVKIAIMAYTGFNQEDSVITNKSSLDRGMFRTLLTRCHKDELKTKGSDTTEFEKPNVKTCKNIKDANYNKIEQNGLPLPGTMVENGDVIIGKTMSSTDLATKQAKNQHLKGPNVDKSTKRDNSTIMKHEETAVVERVTTTVNRDGYRSVSVITRTMMIPDIGDKFSSRHGQKGTNGMYYTQEDMPFTADGRTPDLVVNPHCLTRDTLVHLQCGLSKSIHSLALDGGATVWGWNQNGFIPSKQIEMQPKGMREVLLLTLEDGRTIKCTPEHRFLTSKVDANSDELFAWVEAKDMVISSTNIVCGFEGIEDNTSESQQCIEVQWKNQWGFSMSNADDRSFTLAYMRILGYVLENCVVSAYSASIVCSRCDLGSVLADIRLISRENPQVENFNAEFLIYLPNNVIQTLVSLLGINVTEKCEKINACPIPEFLLEERCPISVVREFLGGLFGGHRKGHFGLGFSQNNLTRLNIQYLAEANREDNAPLRTRFGHIEHLLSKLGIESIISSECNSNFIEYTITINNILAFSKVVGYRHNVQKASHLSAITSYLRAREFQGAGVKNVKEYLTKIGCWQWFSDNSFIDQEHVGHYKLELVSVSSAGVEPVYDISVAGTESFIANGFASHNCVPSRMTIGKLVEGVLGKAAAMEGKFGNGKPFRDMTIEEIGDELHKHGFQRHGNEVMYNGFTGEPIEAAIFFVECFYQRLKHVTAHKFHARARGPIQILTRQPTEGRAKCGGLRVGEMERDNFIAYGAAHVLMDRLFLNSDAYETVVCGCCGLFAEPAKPKNVEIKGMSIRASKAYCRNCDSHDDIHLVRIPYACKLFIQEMYAMNIAVRLKLTRDVTGTPILDTTGQYVLEPAEVRPADAEEIYRDVGDQVMRNVDINNKVPKKRKRESTSVEIQENQECKKRQRIE